MDAFDLFNSAEATLPRKREENDFQKYIQTLFDAYLDQLSKLNADDAITQSIVKLRNRVRELSEALSGAIGHYFDGHPQRAYAEFDSGVTSALDLFGGVKEPETPRDFPLPLYRIRRHGLAALEKKELFHPPFEVRHKVQSERYSIPGFPSLYVSGSLYACWEELHRPTFDSIHVTALWLKKPIKILDFGNRPKRLARLFKSLHSHPMANSIMTFNAILWPLMAVCSIKTMHPDDPFKPEYIISQFVLQWLRTKGEFDAIRFASTHINDEPLCEEAPHQICNYVFPVKSASAAGPCKDLWSMFEMTTPLAWQLCQSIPPESVNGSAKRQHHMRYNLELSPGVNFPYETSSFGTIEQVLHEFARKQGIIDMDYRGPYGWYSDKTGPASARTL